MSENFVDCFFYVCVCSSGLDLSPISFELYFFLFFFSYFSFFNSFSAGSSMASFLARTRVPGAARLGWVCPAGTVRTGMGICKNEKDLSWRCTQESRLF